MNGAEALKAVLAQAQQRLTAEPDDGPVVEMVLGNSEPLRDCCHDDVFVFTMTIDRPFSDPIEGNEDTVSAI